MYLFIIYDSILCSSLFIISIVVVVVVFHWVSLVLCLWLCVQLFFLPSFLRYENHQCVCVCEYMPNNKIKRFSLFSLCVVFPFHRVLNSRSRQPNSSKLTSNTQPDKWTKENVAFFLLEKNKQQLTLNKLFIYSFIGVIHGIMCVLDNFYTAMIASLFSVCVLLISFLSSV